MNRVIVPAGYMGSGSSALTDLISEFDGYSADNGSYEYIFLHCPGGVFDLEDKLLVGNNALRSDEALRVFRETMDELYRKLFWWPANYRKHIHSDFMKVTDKYIESLIDFTSTNPWYYQENVSYWSLPWRAVKRGIALLTNNKVRLPQTLRYKVMKIAMPTPEEFFSKTKKYLHDIFLLLGIEEKNLVLDQLLLPHNLWRIDNYFDGNIECFVADRDPRDVFVTNKYIWANKGEAVPFPVDVKEFCSYYKRLRSLEKDCKSTQVHKFHFEDLIYNYEDSLVEIKRILGVNNQNHIAKKKRFVPENSINNTQLFLLEKFQSERMVIEGELGEYLYNFPYERKPNQSLTF